MTSRKHFFQSRVERRLRVRRQEITVSEWEPDERDQILSRHSINPAALTPLVLESLQNPRLLGIALEVFNLGDLASFQGLTVSRLLFEHIIASERDNPEQISTDEIVDQLRERGKEIVERLETQQHDDLLIFQGEAEALAAGRFYQPVSGEPKHYELRPEGLPLALGCSVAGTLRSKARNGHDLDEALRTILEPIAALDDTVRLNRLDQALTDQDIAAEALAALKCGADSFLKSYVNRKLAMEEPYEQARGLMVAGFSDENEFNTDVLKRFEGVDGLIGQAHQAARYAYERNSWARHWCDQMYHASEPGEVWRYAILLQKIVDARYEVWSKKYFVEGSLYDQYAYSFRHEIKQRIKKWISKREKKLFGADIPHPVFLSHGQ